MTIDLQNEATHVRLPEDDKAFVECVLTFPLSFGFQLRYQATCCRGGRLTRPSHGVRARLGGFTIWRIELRTVCDSVSG